MKISVLLIVITMVLFVTEPAVVAQPAIPIPLPVPREVPVDGGLGLLAAAGGAYAVKKLRARRKEDEAE